MTPRWIPRSPKANPADRGADRSSKKPLWTCPRCGRAFANRNQTHACGRHDLEAHFEGRPPMREAYAVGEQRHLG